MTSTRNFHGQMDVRRAFLGHWQTVKRERKYAHTVEHSRQVLYRFGTHMHPYAERLVRELVTRDVDGLLALNLDRSLRVVDFPTRYVPAQVIAAPDPDLMANEPVAVLATPVPPDPPLPGDSGLPAREIDFDYQNGAYAVYNWEVFFHVPFTIALHLSKNGRYADAQAWFHRIFDPTDTADPAAGPERFWRFRPFQVDEVTHVEKLLANLATGDDQKLQESTVRAIDAWRDQPLRPHLVARTRPTAYMYATVMAYLDNLIDWGDSLFRQDTRESINEATTLYVLAANILGPRPQSIPKIAESKPLSYETLKPKLDAFNNAAVDVEPELGFDLFPPAAPAGETRPEHAAIESIGRGLYFCVPGNDKIDTYYSTIADRFWKIHTSRNLQGVFRQLPLFAPPIDPGMLARAVAAGVDISAISEGSAPGVAPVRFSVLLQKAIEMAQEVRSLGGQLLAALEKKDNEALGVLRARHERSIAEFNEGLKYAQWQDAIKAREGVWLNVVNVFQRFRHYDRLLGTDDSTIKLPDYDGLDTKALDERKARGDEPSVEAGDPEVHIGSSFRDGGHKVNDEEAHEIDLQEAAQILQDVATGFDVAGAVLNMIPNISGKASPFGVGAAVSVGGTNIAALMRDLGMASRGVASRISHEAMLAGKMGGFARREQEWAFQRKSAAGELTQLFKHFRGAEIREHIAKTDHDNARKQIVFADDIVEFLTNEQNARSGDGRKTTTESFYLWMKREAQSLHTRAFDIAHELAKRAEHAAAFELPEFTDTVIGSSYLAGTEGLLAGEKLYLDLKRLELAHLDANTREFELVKHVSLKEWFPAELLKLRANGTCAIPIPEAMFDLDCPGHSFRRIKTVSLSVPCILGPYASVNCSLTLSSSYVRKGMGRYYKATNGAQPADGYDPGNDTTNFQTYTAAVTSVITSSAQSDSGMFETNQRDERYLPFEYAGAIGTWSLELLGTPRPFDYDSIADVVLTIRYTARPGGNVDSAKQGAAAWLDHNAARSFSMRHEFASEWAAFKQAAPDTPATLKFVLDDSHYPYRMKDSMAKAQRMQLVFTGETSGDVTLKRNDQLVDTVQGAVSDSVLAKPFDRTGAFELAFPSNGIDDLWIVVDWTPAEP
jgi:hypothetical protein